MRKKCVFWFVLWGILLWIGTQISTIEQLINVIERGVLLRSEPYTTLQKVLLLGFIPLCLIPTLAISHYNAIREKNRVFQIITMCLILHHALCVIIVLFQI